MADIASALQAAAQRARPHWPLLPGLLLGAALRFPGLAHDLYGDEAEYATVSRSLAQSLFLLVYPAIEGFGPQPFVSQPPFLLYLGAWAGAATSPAFGPLLVSATLGTLTIAVVYVLGLRFRGRWMGAVAALFLAILPFHVAVSRSAQLDAGFTFLVALTLLAFTEWLRDPRPRWALATGAALAMTVFGKLPGVLVALPVVAVLALRWGPLLRRREDAARWPEARRRLVWEGRQGLLMALPPALAGLLYLLQLALLRSTGDLLDKLGWQAARVSGAVPGTFERGWTWYFTSEVGLWVQWGFGLVFLAIAGTALAVLHALRANEPGERWPTVALLLWPLPLTVFLVASTRKEWFYAMPLTPVLVLLAAWAIHDAAAAAYRASKPVAGVEWWRTPGALLAGAGMIAIACFAPLSFTMQRQIVGDGYGAALDDAAEWIHAEDPEAAQVGTLLGRYSLHFYNGQDTYHYFVNHTWLDGEVEAGRLRYAVIDPYLGLEYEEAWLLDLVRRHGGERAASFDNGHGRTVDVYRLA
jgi:4-amino-4-deoxy-L-arabinose transferase-like glycosyltransferase